MSAVAVETAIARYRRHRAARPKVQSPKVGDLHARRVYPPISQGGSANEDMIFGENMLDEEVPTRRGGPL